MSIAVVFPGQGSQNRDMADSFSDVSSFNEVIDQGSEILNYDVREAIRDEKKINDTIFTQPLMLTISYAMWDTLIKETNIRVHIGAGHSLGEYTALVANKTLSFNDALLLVKKRAEFMSSAMVDVDGAMAAVIGFDRDQLDLLVKRIDDIVIANDNSSSQVVLSGTNEALDNLSREITCKRFLKLNVSGAFHSPFMSEPSTKFSEYLKKIQFKNPSFPVISNYEPSLCSDPNELKNRLEKQMCNGVRWRETMDLMAKDSDLHIVEIGPSNVLSGLGKRHIKDVKISQVSSSDQISY